MDFEPAAVKLATIHWYALKIETLAVEAWLTKSKDQPVDYNFDRERAILRRTVSDLVGLKILDGTISCDPPLVPCEGFCVDECPKPASSSSAQTKP